MQIGAKMVINETSLTPLFIQIAEWIEDEILKGNILEEEQIPSTNNFAAMYRINPATAGKGINLLVDEGVIYKKRGIGMFVNTGAKQIIVEKRKDKFLKESVKTLLSEAKKLGIGKEEIIKIMNDID